MSQIFIAILLLILSLGASETSSAQTSDASMKAHELTAALDKTKYKKKEKKNVVAEFYIDIKNEAAVKNSAAEYSGSYFADDGNYNVELRVSTDGRVEGSGTDTRFEGLNFDKQKLKKFTFRNARIEGALLTATKVYEDGETRKFEAVFVNRTVLTGKNPNEIETRETKFGLGFIETHANFSNRVFCEFKP